MDMENNEVNSNKRLAINMVSNIVSYSSTLIVSFVLTPYLINTLGKEAYSFYPLANNFISYMSILTNALNSMSSRFITRALNKKEYDKANKYFSSILFSNIIMAGILIIPMMLIIIFVDQILEIPVNLLSAVRTLFCFSFSSMLVNIITAVFGVATFAKNRIDLRSLRELCVSIIRIVLFYILFTCFSPTIVYVGVVAFIIALINFGFQRIYTQILLPEIKISIRNYNIKYIKEVLASGIWNSINSLGNMLLANSSLIMANMFYGAIAAGEYSIVQTVPNFINGVISMLTGVFFPLITIAFAQGNKNKLISEVHKSQVMVGYFSTSVIGVFIGLSYQFFTLWTPGENYSQLVFLSTLTILPHCIIGCIWSLSNLNIAMNKIKIPALYVLGSGLINIITCYLVYRIFNPGVASIPLISSVIQIIWVGVFFPIYASKQMNISIATFYPPILRGICCTIIAVVLSKMISNIIVINSWVKLFGCGILVGAIVLLINLFVMFDKNNRKFVIEFLKSKIDG